MNSQCYRCFAPTTIQPCTQCRQIEATEKQNALVAEANKQQQKLAQQAAYEAESIAREQAYQQARANAILVSIEEQKLREIQKQTRLIEESTITDDEAYEEGRKLNFLNSSTRLVNNINEDCSITLPSYDNPYLIKRLKEAYELGVKDHWYSFTADQNYFEDMVLSAGREGMYNFFIPFILPNGATATIERNIVTYTTAINQQTGHFEVQKTGQLPFTSNRLNRIYERGLNQYIKNQIQEMNTEELIQKRLEEIEQIKRDWDAALDREFKIAMFVVFALFLGLGYGTFWFISKILAFF